MSYVPFPWSVGPLVMALAVPITGLGLSVTGVGVFSAGLLGLPSPDGFGLLPLLD